MVGAGKEEEESSLRVKTGWFLVECTPWKLLHHPHVRA